MNTLVWFRRNLRVSNNPALIAACESTSANVAGAFFYDAQYTGEFQGMKRCGPLRAGFLWQSLADLRNRLEQTLHIPLIIQRGEAAGQLAELCLQLDIQEVHTQKLWAHEEQVSAEAARATLAAIGITLIEHECYTLLPSNVVSEKHPTELSSFSKFRRKVEGAIESGVGESGVSHHFLCPQANQSFLEQVKQIQHNLHESPIASAQVTNKKAVLPFLGGETAGMQRLVNYCKQPLGHYKETRNGLIGADYSSKLSPWLNLGCISPQQVLGEVRKYEQLHGANASTEWLIVEMLWRDFFQYLANERGAELFFGSAEPLGPRKGTEKLGSVTAVPDPSFSDPTFYGTKKNELAQWCMGETRNEFLNANMRELNSTGFMSNRGRQNVASALIHDLHLDWRWGAAWFEAQLLDYDPASNYGNWQYIGGLAANTRGGSWFNLEKQANVYDTDGAYRKLWCSANP